MRFLFLAFVGFSASAGLLFSAMLTNGQSSSEHVSIVANEADHRADILIDGKPFTSYIWPATLKKPVLYPLRTANGTIATRGFPLKPHAGQRVDHPHHAGLWFNYEDVNGIDFWNNSEAIKPEDAPKMGTIVQHSIASAESGRKQGILEAQTDWTTYDKKILLKEATRFVFRGGPGFRSIDRITALIAQEERVNFHYAKGGLPGLRVVRALEIPSGRPESYVDASGRVTAMAKMDNTGVNGTYLTSDGKTGDAAWGTRGHRCNLSDKIGDEPVSITIFDHPANPGFPTYWHARGYGLFAANPLGKKIFGQGKQELNFSLPALATAMFYYRILISSLVLSPEATEAAYKEFVASYPR